ncbi:YjdF family protein [Anaerostipes sp.]|uniref:YjdF family protein n=1 Tax=Anaerostipes sp. TaxID=1872530 RepID=UPI0025C46794|nr:YjdF family protein [Anaerostipes sp.]MBS7009762.1 YjdF family protein [Anaerostipes sp.]
MQKIKSRLTVYFDAPFWIGIYERISDGGLEVCKITFGAEPKDYEVQAFLMEHYEEFRFSPVVEIAVKAEKKMNPKRMQRSLQRHRETGIGTKSQQALAAQREARKAERKECRKAFQEKWKREQFLKKQEKKKQKHRGK